MSQPALREIALAAIARRLPPEADTAPAAAVLREARTAVSAAWTAGPLVLLRLALAAPAAGDRLVARLASAYALSAVESLAIALAFAVEDDRRVGHALALLQGGDERPTLGLLDQSLTDCVEPGGDRRPATVLLTGPALAAGLLSRSDDGASLAAASLRLPLTLFLAMRGGLPPVGACEPPPALVAPGMALAAQRHAVLVEAGGPLVIRGGDEGERRVAAALVAGALGSRALVLDLESARLPGLGAACLLGGLVPAVVLPSGDKATAPSLAGWRGPLLLLVGKATLIEGATAAPTWRLIQPDADERRGLWRTALGAGPAAETAARLRSGSARIANLALAIRGAARLAGRDQPEPADVAAALADHDPGLGSLATPVRDQVDDAAVVFPPAVRRELDLLELRCRQREQLESGLGASFVARSAQGVRALLVGAPGTGKTLAGSWLATRLGQPLYRVDLAAVASKYIGETEQNLGRLLDTAEAADVILLFDEADALFANRTEVRDASDRHANGVVNYLLSRLEGHAGIVLLTANSRARFDAAFARRLDAVIEIPLPGPGERRALWRSHLGDGHGLSANDLNRLAAAADLAGGHIRNAVLTAALIARADERPIGWNDVIAALASECRKLGRALPNELQPRPTSA